MRGCKSSSFLPLFSSPDVCVCVWIGRGRGGEHIRVCLYVADGKVYAREDMCVSVGVSL